MRLSTNPCIFYLSGGLGNQLHQLSAALGVSKYTPVKLSLALISQSRRDFEIRDFIANSGLNYDSKFCDCSKSIKATDLTRINPFYPPCCILTYPEPAPWLFHNSNPLDFYKILSSGLKRKYTIEAVDELIMHFRLGDYLWPRALFRYGVLKKSYYEECVARLPSKYSINGLTDDPGAIQKIYGSEISGRSININSSKTVQEDFVRMINAKFFVSGNSSLSLWALWYRQFDSSLNNSESISLGPTRLYRKEKENSYSNIGSIVPNFYNPMTFLLRHPFSFKRRLKWRGKYW